VQLAGGTSTSSGRSDMSIPGGSLSLASGVDGTSASEGAVSMSSVPSALAFSSALVIAHIQSCHQVSLAQVAASMTPVFEVPVISTHDSASSHNFLPISLHLAAA